MSFFKKKTEKTVRTDIIDEAYIDKLLSGDRKPVKPAKKPLPHKKLLIIAGGIGLVLVFSLITTMIAVSVGRRTDPDFGFRDLFAPATESSPQQTTTVPGSTAGTTQPTTEAVEPTAEPTTEPATEPTTEPTEPPLRIHQAKRGEITYLIPSKTLDLSLWQDYCTKPSLPIPDENAPEEEWIQLFYSMFKNEDSWYNQALIGRFSSPENIYMTNLLCEGIAQGGRPLQSYPEAQWLLEHGFKPEDNVVRVPVADIHSLVSIYFGTTFEAHDMTGCRFNEQTGCYYFTAFRALKTPVLGIVDFEWQEDGNVCVRYAAESGQEAVLMKAVLRPVGDYFQILSNLPVPKNPVTIDLEEIPDVSECVNYPSQLFIEGGYSGYAKWGEYDEFSIELPLLEPFCEGAKEINAEIKSLYQSVIDEVKKSAVYQTSTSYWKVYYETYLSGDVLSIVIYQRWMAGDNASVNAFNLDLSTGQQLDHFEMIRRYTGMTYPEFLLRANYTIVNHLRKENPSESETVTDWLHRVENDIWMAYGHKLILNDEGTLTLLNGYVRSIVAGYRNVQIPFDPKACGEEFADWELESYRWLFGIPADGAFASIKSTVLKDTFFFDPERFLRYLSGSEYWLSDVARLLTFELHPDKVIPLRDLCNQYLGRSDTAKAAQAILDQLEKYADIY